MKFIENVKWKGYIEYDNKEFRFCFISELDKSTGSPLLCSNRTLVLLEMLIDFILMFEIKYVSGRG